MIRFKINSYGKMAVLSFNNTGIDTIASHFIYTVLDRQYIFVVYMVPMMTTNINVNRIWLNVDRSC